MYKSLPNSNKVLNLKVVGETTGLEYEGKFVVKRALSIKDKQSIELTKTRITEDTANPSNSLFAIASMVALLRARLVEYPEWWKELGFGSELLDENVLIELFDKSENLALEWRQSLQPKEEELGNGKGEKKDPSP